MPKNIAETITLDRQKPLFDEYLRKHLIISLISSERDKQRQKLPLIEVPHLISYKTSDFYTNPQSIWVNLKP